MLGKRYRDVDGIEGVAAVAHLYLTGEVRFELFTDDGGSRFVSEDGVVEVEA